jgi:LysM repeat protein
MSNGWNFTGFVAILVLLLTSCGTTPQLTPTSTKDTSVFNCAALTLDAKTACLNVLPSQMVLQSAAGSEIALNLYGAQVTLNGTLFLKAVFNYSLTIGTLEGISVVGAFGATRVIQPGGQVTLRLGGEHGLQVTDAPSLPHPIDVVALSSLPLEQLGRAIEIPKPIAPPPEFTPLPTLTETPTTDPTITSSPTKTETAVKTSSPKLTQTQDTTTLTISPPTETNIPTTAPTATTCSVREDWLGVYTIQRGDTLGRIAQQFDLNLEELQEANCIADANRIRVGQVLRLPTSVFNDVPTARPPSRTPSGVDFRAEQTTLQAGQCTTIRWDVDNVSAIYFEEEATTGHNARQVCPSTTDTYTLLVIYLDGGQVPYSLTINVIETTQTLSP